MKNCFVPLLAAATIVGCASTADAELVQPPLPLANFPALPDGVIWVTPGQVASLNSLIERTLHGQTECRSGETGLADTSDTVLCEGDGVILRLESVAHADPGVRDVSIVLNKRFCLALDLNYSEPSGLEFLGVDGIPERSTGEPLLGRAYKDAQTQRRLVFYEAIVGDTLCLRRIDLLRVPA